jgi:hypothetical protein
MAPDQPVKPGESVVWRRVDESVVAVEMTGGAVYELEGPAARIWELLCEGRSRDDIAAELVGEYEVDTATLERDLERTLAELADAALIDR